MKSKDPVQEFAPILKVNEEVEDTLGRQCWQIGLRVVVGELVDPAVVVFTGALGEAFSWTKRVKS